MPFYLNIFLTSRFPLCEGRPAIWVVQWTGSTAPSLICPITLPRIKTILYGLFSSDIEIATLGSLDTFLCFTLPSTVLIKILLLSSSRSIHIGVTWGEPSFISVDRWAKFFPLSNRITGSVIRLMTINSIIIVQSMSNNDYPILFRFLNFPCSSRRNSEK